MKKLILILFVLFAFVTNANAQDIATTDIGSPVTNFSENNTNPTKLSKDEQKKYYPEILKVTKEKIGNFFPAGVYKNGNLLIWYSITIVNREKIFYKFICNKNYITQVVPEIIQEEQLPKMN